MPSDFVNVVVQTYRRLTTPHPMAHKVDLTGKNAIVTGGAERSIGYEVAKTLAAWGADVVVTTLVGGQRLEQSLHNDLRSLEVDEPRLTAREMDLSDPASVADFVAWYAERTDELHVLVNNAGVFKDMAKRSKAPILAADGIEVHWRVNFLGTFHLTMLLIPMLKHGGAGGDARVVITSSDPHRLASNASLFSENSGDYDSWDTYARSKLALVHFSNEIQRRYAEEFNLQSAVLHPGSVQTNLQLAGLDRNPVLSRMHRLAEPLMKPFFLTPNQGAQTTIFCATTTPLEGGRYYESCAISEASEEASEELVAKRLWDEAADWVAAQEAAHGAE